MNGLKDSLLIVVFDECRFNILIIIYEYVYVYLDKYDQLKDKKFWEKHAQSSPLSLSLSLSLITEGFCLKMLPRKCGELYNIIIILFKSIIFISNIRKV